MSKLRPECGTSNDVAMADDTALFLIRNSVRRRRELIYGKLHEQGRHCALGAFWNDNPGITLRNSLIDEVAAVNDSVPPTATPQERWKTVNSWLRFKIAALTLRKEVEKKP